MGKTTTLHVHHWPFFVYFFAVPAQLTTWNDQILSLIENGNRKALNSTISVWARARSPLFSSNQNSLLLSNRANWDNRENVLKTFLKKDAESIFQRRFHGRRRCRIVRSLIVIRELKQRRRQRQRERQKSNRFTLEKQQVYTCITLFCQFLCCCCTTKTWIFLVLRRKWTQDTDFLDLFLNLDTVL